VGVEPVLDEGALVHQEADPLPDEELALSGVLLVILGRPALLNPRFDLGQLLPCPDRRFLGAHPLRILLPDEFRTSPRWDRSVAREFARGRPIWSMAASKSIPGFPRAGPPQTPR